MWPTDKTTRDEFIFGPDNAQISEQILKNAPVTDFVGRPSQGCSKFPTAEEKEKPPFYRLILNWKIEVQIQNVLIYIIFILRKFRRKSHRRGRGLGLAGPRPNNILGVARIS